jgi:glucans biosynthesis protein
MHGGVAGVGAPKGNKNALKSGHYTRDAIAERRMQRKEAKEIMKYLSASDFWR